MSITAMKEALFALEAALSDDRPYILHCEGAITALRTAIAEAEKVEPVGYLTLDGDFIQNQRWVMEFGVVPRGKLLFLAAGAQPAQKQEPVAWYDEEMDCAYTASELDGGTADGLAPLFLAAGAQVQQEAVAWDVEESVLAIHRILKSAASFSTKEGALRSELKSVFQAGRVQPPPKQDQCWCDATGIGEPGVSCGDCPKDYAPPVQAQERKPLTDEQITEVWRELRAQKEDWSDLDFARAIEAYIKEQA